MSLTVYLNRDDIYNDKSIEVVKMDGRYYIELNEFGTIESLADLNILMAANIDYLKERVSLLEGRLKIHEDFFNNF